ncbi:hypothetical protein [Paenibacillus xylaniclasticus]|uniref:hypothetical protein n=1 Tax=Paenibacillus xylaniclasticus TaxID=588083 RepID=UPI000FD9D8F5|nr:hypothetical protein [Paenibacillus xylaniclasticus]
MEQYWAKQSRKNKKGSTVNIITIVKGNLVIQYATSSGQIIKVISDAKFGGQSAFFGGSNTKEKTVDLKKVYKKPKRYPSFKKGMFY